MHGRAICFHLLNGPYVTVDGKCRTLSEGSKRLLVLVAIRGRVTRRQAAQLLWPGVDAARGAGNLRSASWRLRCADLPLLVEHEGTLRLAPEIQVDVEVLCRRARQMAKDGASRLDLGVLATAVEALDLLSGWYEDWAVMERERVRALMLQAIEAISVRLCRAGRCAEAIDAALVAVTADPLRDSGQRALIFAHLGEGNLGEARRAYVAYGRVLRRELGIDPPEHLARLVGAPVTGTPATIPGQTGRASRLALVPS